MRVIKRINNNTALCEDANGRQVVAFGRGVGFQTVGTELPLSVVERTFYDVNERMVALVDELSPQVLLLAFELADRARRELPYVLARNIELSLADHIAFAIERANKHIRLAMPLEIEIKQNYPLEYQLGIMACRLINERFSLELPESEAVGIAITVINGASGPDGQRSAGQYRDDHMLDAITREIERRFAVKLKRESFEYTRFSTHLYYLFRRIRNNVPLTDLDGTMYRVMGAELPDIAACVEAICDLLHREWGREVDDGERLFLLLHVNRVLQEKR